MCWKYDVKWFLLCVEWALTMRISRNLRYEKKNDDRDGHIQQYYLVPRLDLCILWCLLTWQEITSLHLSRLWLVQHETVATLAYLENERTSRIFVFTHTAWQCVKGRSYILKLEGERKGSFSWPKTRTSHKIRSKKMRSGESRLELNTPIQFAQVPSTPSRIFFKTDTIFSVLAFRPQSKGVGIAGLQKQRIFVFKGTDEIGGFRTRHHTAHAL